MLPNAAKLSAEILTGRPPQGAPIGWHEQCTVLTVSAGAAADGNALVTIDWRTTPVQAAYLASYTPTVGHRVLVLNQGGALTILGRIIGTPPTV